VLNTPIDCSAAELRRRSARIGMEQKNSH